MSKARHGTESRWERDDASEGEDESESGSGSGGEHGAGDARERCPECDGRLDASGHETVCADCGLVVSADRIDHGPEWRSFADDDTNPERTGAPLTRSRHDRGLSTEIGYTRVKGRKRRQWARMRRQHNRARIATKRDRNQVYAFTEIRRLVGALSLPESVREQAAVLFRRAQEEDLLRGRTLEGFAAAAVYAACRVASVSRTVEEVAEAARATVDEQRAAYDALNRELGLPTGPIDPAEYVPRFATRLDLPGRVESRARRYARWTVEAGVAAGRDPSGVAVACLYTASRDENVPLTQREAADAADVTPVTLRNTYEDLCERGRAAVDDEAAD
jgi:transcription initiation factor TFIIB